MLFDDADLQLESAAFRFNLPIGGTSSPFVPAEAIQIRRSTVLQRWMIRGKH